MTNERKNSPTNPQTVRPGEEQDDEQNGSSDNR